MAAGTDLCFGAETPAMDGIISCQMDNPVIITFFIYQYQCRAGGTALSALQYELPSFQKLQLVLQSQHPDL